MINTLKPFRIFFKFTEIFKFEARKKSHSRIVFKYKNLGEFKARFDTVLDCTVKLYEFVDWVCFDTTRMDPRN